MLYVKVLGVFKGRDGLYIFETRRCIFIHNNLPTHNFVYIHSMSKATPEMMKDRSLTYDYHILN
jgi:hypothetical protein